LKVSDLEVGMILRPILNRWTQSRMRFTIRETIGEKYIKTKDKPPESVGSKVFNTLQITGIQRTCKPIDIVVYMGSENSEFWLNGVKKHHLVLADGLLTVLCGYEFRYVEPAYE